MNGAIKVEIDGNVIGLKFVYPAIRMFLMRWQRRVNLLFQSDGGEPMMTVKALLKFIQCGYKMTA